MVHDKPPPPFKLIKDVISSVGSTSCTIAIVVDSFTPVASRGTDWTLGAHLCDRTAPNKEESIAIRWFFPRSQVFELNIGDAVIIRSFNVRLFQNVPTLLKSYTSNWIIKNYRTGKLTCYPPSAQVNTDEMLYLNDLVEWWQARNDVPMGIGYNGITNAATTTAAAVPVGRSKKFCLVKDMQEKKFYDMIGCVVKIYPSGGNHTTVYITDYTSNEMLYDWQPNGKGRKPDSTYPQSGGYQYHDESVKREWQGPMGQFTLLVTFWGNQSVFVREEMDSLVGATLLLKNMRVKINSDGRCLEGVLDDDKEHLRRKQFAKLSSSKDYPDLQDFLKRKKEFEKHESKRRMYYSEQIQKRESEAQAEAEKERAKIEEHERKFQAETNPNIKTTGRDDVQYSTLSDIINPLRPDKKGFRNSKYRVKVKVVDYFPHEISDFTVKKIRKEKPRLREGQVYLSTQFQTQIDVRMDVDDDDEDDPSSQESFYKLSDSEDDDHMDLGKPRNDWVWRFGLLLEDEEGNSLGVGITNSDAQFLLNEEPGNLREDEDLQDKIRQKLDILWGNLAELKEKRLGLIAKHILQARKEGREFKRTEIMKTLEGTSDWTINNRFFNANIFEYGIKKDGEVKRKFALQGVKIVD